jgi:ribose transport system substrate-binding protein
MMEPDILISIPTDTEKTSATFKKIASSKTKLILIANIPEGLNPKDYVTCVSVNERSHGRNAGYGLGEYMTKFNLSNYGTIRHKQSFYATNQRDNAAEQILAEEYPDLKLCGTVYFDKEEAVYDKTIELMTQHPEINGLYVSWEGPAAKALKALTDIERTDVIITTADLEYPLALNMAKGGMLKAISSQCPYEQGQAMALAAANALLEKPVPSFIGVEPIYITSDNLLKSWKKVCKEEPSPQLISALNENPNYFTEQS